MSKKTWIIFGAIVVLLLGGLIGYSRATNPAVNVSGVDTNAVQGATDANGQIADHVYSTSTGKVTFIEYGDYECPYCGQAYPQVKQLAEEYKNQVTFIFRNYPLTTIHANARAAAAVAEAAGQQGKYWQMHDALYEGQADWESLTGDARTNAFLSYAKTIGLDITKYNAALADGAKTVNKKISFDQALGKKLNVTSTPSFYLDGTLISNAANQDLQTTGGGSQVKAQINAALKAAGVALPDGESA